MRLAVAVLLLMVLLPLVVVAERIEPVRPVHRQHAVEMVDLVLHQLGHVPFQFHLVPLPPQVLVAHPHVMRAQHAHVQVGDREAIVPDGEVLMADIHDLGIHQHPRLAGVDVHEPDRRPDLGRGDAASPALVPPLPVVQRVREVVGDDPHGGRAGVGDGLAAGAQDRVAEATDSTDGHARKVGIPDGACQMPPVSAGAQSPRLKRSSYHNQYLRSLMCQTIATPIRDRQSARLTKTA